MWPFNRKRRGKKRPSRTKLFVWTLVITGIMGIIQIALPIEDIHRGLRNQLRARPADPSIVVVAIDNKTVSTYGKERYSREYNARLLDRLFAMGAKRVYFDEAFSIPEDAAGDAAFAHALSRYSGRVFTGALFIRHHNGKKEPVVAAPVFSGRTPLRSLNGAVTPFNLSAELVFADDINGEVTPSISTDIAGRSGPVGSRYRPDWSIQAKTFPTISLVDAVNGKVADDAFRGKDVLIGETMEYSSDYLQILGQQWIPGVYVHAVGAQTLKEGVPIDIGFLPAWLVAASLAALALRVRANKKFVAVAATGAVLGIFVPFALDIYFVTAAFVPAYVMFGVVVYRAATLRTLAAARLKNAGSLLPTISALREEPAATERPIIAMRIRNYAAICASFDTPVDDELVNELARRLALPDSNSSFYQAEDVLYWLGPTLSPAELEDHLSGLARIIESHFEIRGRKLDIHVAFGVEMDLMRPVVNRIGRALLAADNAASKHRLIQFNFTTNDEDTAWELSLMTELDDAIDAGDIWIAYQPQFDLRTDRISGAEALVRWQHPTRGAISPEAFVLPAESHKRIKRLTFHILEQATSSTRHILATDPDFRLSVNISASLLEYDQLPAHIAQILIQTGFPASNLTLEVTESAPFSEHEVVARNLIGISAIGIDLSIDDYGTGNATLEYLRSVPCQEIKIDRRFVGGLVNNASDMLLVESTIELAHGLGRRVIAEGIEDPETLEMLRSIGCDIAQGYYLARPMHLEALTTILEINHAKVA